ncbi:MAG: winged helix-turn-helix domain-containing protein [Cyclobacteriaceae bacterium]
MEIGKGKLKSVVQHCVYEISTGKWSSGEKLPSVRKAEKMWGVNRLTVLSAYRKLMEMGLVISEDRRGYFVATQTESKETIHQRDQLDQLYKKVVKLIKSNTSFEPHAVLKYFASLAEEENDLYPETAFIECSEFQAEGHAKEIKDRLNVSIQPLLLDQGIRKLELPPNIRTLLTTGFHILEVKKIGKRLDLDVVNVPIKVDTGLFENISINFNAATVFELEEAMSRDIFNDVKALTKSISLKEKIVQDVNSEIEDFLSTHSNEIILLSPRVWGRTAKKWRQNPRVHLIKFSIQENSWPIIVEAVKLPFASTY